MRLAALALAALAAACVTIPGRTPQTPFERPGPHVGRVTILRF